jgi:hypothetical protein
MKKIIGLSFLAITLFSSCKKDDPTPTCTGVTISLNSSKLDPTNGQSNGSITLTATPNGSYTFSINNGPYQSSNVFNNLSAGTYTFMAKNANGCISDSISISLIATPCTLSSTSILGTYKITGYTTQANAQAPIVDDYATWPACEKDDLVTLSAGGVFTTSEGVISCTPPTDPISANWTLAGNSLVISYMGFALPAATISDFTCNGFKMTSVDATNGEIDVTTLTKQ